VCQAKEITATSGKDLERLNARTKEVTKEVAAIQKQLDSMDANESKLQETVRHARSRMEDARQTATQQSSGTKVLEAIMRAQKDGKLAGVHGRLGPFKNINQ
jgi:chromosome segregation ATPase